MTLAILLGISDIATDIGTRTAATVQSNQMVHSQAAMAVDLEALEKSVKNVVSMQTTLEWSGNPWPNLPKERLAQRKKYFESEQG